MDRNEKKEVKLFPKRGIAFPMGYRATGVSAGLKKNGQKDLAVIICDAFTTAVGVYTNNAVKGHSLEKTIDNVNIGLAGAVIINSGNANACIGEEGKRIAEDICETGASVFGIRKENVLIGSTGVIGQVLDIECMRKGIRMAAEKLFDAEYDKKTGETAAAEAIMTTDLVKKEVACTVDLGGKSVRIGAMAKGSGMIHPDMATMIGLITTDANVDRDIIKKILKAAVGKTFNRVSVDGDTSVCDMVLCLANGEAGNTAIVEKTHEYEVLLEAVTTVCTHLAKQIAKDGEGATKLIEIEVKGTKRDEDAYRIACAVAKSPLVKTAIFGGDANWGRIITAVGYAGVKIDPGRIDIYIGDTQVCDKGCAMHFDEARAARLLKKKEIKIIIDINSGSGFDRMWTCDFSYDYVRINGSYRS